MTDTMQKLIAMLNEQMPDVDTSAVTPDSSLTLDLGLDSMSTVMLAINIDEIFGVMLGEDFVPGTVGELCDYIDARRTK